MRGWSDGEARARFAAAGICSLQDMCAISGGEVVSRARTRTCRRLELSGQAFYVKVQLLRARVLPLRRWPSYLGKGSPLLREAQALATLADLGIRVPRLCYAGGERSWWGMPRRAALVTRELAGHLDLARLAREEPRRALAAADRVEALVADLHGRGWVLGGLKYRNVLVDGAGELALLDLPDLGRSAARGRRHRDLRILAGERARLLPA